MLVFIWTTRELCLCAIYREREKKFNILSTIYWNFFHIYWIESNRILLKCSHRALWLSIIMKNLRFFPLDFIFFVGCIHSRIFSCLRANAIKQIKLDYYSTQMVCMHYFACGERVSTQRKHHCHTNFHKQMRNYFPFIFKLNKY